MRKSALQPIRIGVLFSETGVTSAVETTQRNAALLAIAEINEAGGIEGRPLEPVVADPGSDPRRYAAQAREMLETAGIRLILGCYMSSTRKAVLPLIEQHQALLFYPTLYEGFEFSPNCYYGGACPNQNSIWLVKYLQQEFGNEFYLVGSNYVFPYESNRIMRDYIETEGGRVQEERYIPLHPSAADIARIIADLRGRGPVTVLSTVVGDGVAMFYQACHAAGFSPDEMPIGSLTTGEPEVAAIGHEAARGHYTSAPYFETVRTQESRSFVARYRRRFGATAPVSACTEAAYFQVHLLAEGLRTAASDQTDDLRAALAAAEYDAPQGRVRIDGANNHTYLWPRIARTGADGRFEVVRESRAAVRPDPYLMTFASTDWSLASTAA